MIVLILVNVFCLVSGSIMLIQATEYMSFGADFVEQEKTCWCWAASAQNSARWEVNTSRDQYSAVRKIKGSWWNPYPNVGGSLEDMENAAEYISEGTEEYERTKCSTTSGVKSFEFLRNEVRNLDVTIVVGGYYDADQNRTGGHACICIGYSIDDAGQEYLLIYNPWDGTRSKVLYTTFLNGYGSRQYDGTVWNVE